MELDSIIYIVIAIALAIINAVAQKKKKAAQGQAPIQPTVDYSEGFDQEEYEESEVQVETFNDMLKVNPLEALFGDIEPLFESENKAVAEEVIRAPIKVVQEPTRTLTDFELKMQETAERMLGDIGDHSIPEFDDDNIASSEIGNVLTIEEEEIAFNESRNNLLKEFDPKKAIVYSEIIKPKYFSIGV
jgi:hypothetical protein